MFPPRTLSLLSKPSLLSSLFLELTGDDLISPSNSPIFCQNIPGYLCYNNAGCFMGDTQCPDGSCVSNRSLCQNGPSNNAGGKPNWGGCNDTQVRCFGARYGTCNNTAADCPAVPSRGIVMPFAGTIGNVVCLLSLCLKYEVSGSRFLVGCQLLACF